MNALLTDLYQLTMAAGYWSAGKVEEVAAFELFTRKLPPGRDYLIAAGLMQAVEYLLNLQFTGADIDYLRQLQVMAGAAPSFFEYLREFRFTGDVWAMPEGTPVLPNEPLLTLRAPLIEAQIPETFLLATIGFQTMIASKAIRVVEAAAGKPVVEMGTRRAHSPEAGTLAARACYIGGCAGTSNVLTGFRYGVPVYGTAAHSWIMSFPTERQAFAELQKLLGQGTTYLIDTYDTLQGARNAASLGRPIAGVRLDSGDLAGLATQVRSILDAAGLPEAKIMVTGDLQEAKVQELRQSGAPIDSYGVGTELVTSSDAPNLAVVYKMVEIAGRGTAKKSESKATLPGRKQVFRQTDGTPDILALADEYHPGESLLVPVLAGGELVQPLPDVHAARQRARTAKRPASVIISDRLKQLAATAGAPVA